jgi:hypothetical protein
VKPKNQTSAKSLNEQTDAELGKLLDSIFLDMCTPNSSHNNSDNNSGIHTPTMDFNQISQDLISTSHGGIPIYQADITTTPDDKENITNTANNTPKDTNQDSENTTTEPPSNINIISDILKQDLMLSETDRTISTSTDLDSDCFIVDSRPPTPQATPPIDSLKTSPPPPTTDHEEDITIISPPAYPETQTSPNQFNNIPGATSTIKALITPVLTKDERDKLIKLKQQEMAKRLNQLF